MPFVDALDLQRSPLYPKAVYCDLDFYRADLVVLSIAFKNLHQRCLNYNPTGKVKYRKKHGIII
jgi:hypothetical protein